MFPAALRAELRAAVVRDEPAATIEALCLALRAEPPPTAHERQLCAAGRGPGDASSVGSFDSCGVGDVAVAATMAGDHGGFDSDYGSEYD